MAKALNQVAEKGTDWRMRQALMGMQHRFRRQRSIRVKSADHGGARCGISHGDRFAASGRFMKDFKSLIGGGFRIEGNVDGMATGEGFGRGASRHCIGSLPWNGQVQVLFLDGGRGAFLPTAVGPLW